MPVSTWSSDPTMSTNPLLQTIEALAKEKGIEPDVVIQAMEEAVLTASRKFYKTGEDLKAKFNPENGQVELFAVKTIVVTALIVGLFFPWNFTDIAAITC